MTLPALIVAAAIASSPDAGSPAAATEPELAAVLAEAAAAGKPVLLDFGATWCGPCQYLREFVFTAPRVKRALEGYRVQEYDVDRRPGSGLAEQLHVTALPRLVLMNADGVAVTEIHARRLPDDMARTLNEWRRLGTVRGKFLDQERAARAKDAGFHLVDGLVQHARSDRSKAAAGFKRAVALDPDNALGFGAVAAWALLEAKPQARDRRSPGYAAALWAYAQKYGTDPRAIRALDELASLVTWTRPAEAKIQDVVTSALRAREEAKDGLGLEDLAWACLRFGYLGLADRAASSAVAIDGDEPGPLLIQAAVQLVSGNKDAAAATVDRALKRHPGFEPLQHAKEQLEQGRPIGRGATLDLFED